ncbi:MAG: site-specific DNA-methyltransferase [Nitrososphaeria archaeon]
MSAKNNPKLQDYKEEFVVEEEEKPITLPEQEELFKMPKKFGTVPDVDKVPLDWDSKKGYTHLFPQLRLPFQKIEEFSFGNPDLEPKNRLFWGDNLHIMRLLPSESIDLIYIDPPFFSGRNYNVIFGDQNEIITFKDIWEGGIHTYLVWLNARLVEMKRLLKPTGSIYVHLDWHAVHYVKVEMDKIFGYDNFQNEIIWHYETGGASKARFSRKHDNILWYTKSAYDYKYYGERIMIQRTEKSIKRAQNPKGARISATNTEKNPNDVFLIQQMNPMAKERIGYPTQKPEALLERIIKASSNEGDVVADFFCGGGTTPAVAQRLGRRWIASDISRIAVEITKGRILKLLKSETRTQISLGKIPNIEVWSWGFYDVDKLKNSGDDEFKEFVVRAFGGRPIIGEKAISGVKNGLPILVGSKDPKKPITKDEVLGFAKYIDANYELRKTGIILAWSFSDDAIKARDALANLGSDVEFVKIKTLRIGSVEFINEVIENKEEYKKVFRFVFPPQVILRVYKEDHKTYIFDFSDSVSLNNGKIINIQADFDFDGKFVPTEGYVFNLDELILKYHFNSDGKKKIAFMVEDDQGGEKLIIKELSV